MIDSPDHHLVYGLLEDYLSGVDKPDTDDERIRQQLARFMVEECGYAKEELESGLEIYSEINGKTVKSYIDFVVRVNGMRLMIIRYGAGSLVTREKGAIAAARILEPGYRIPFAVVTNGRDAELLDSKNGKVLARGMKKSFFNHEQAVCYSETLRFEPYADEKLREQAVRILNVFDENLCCLASRTESGCTKGTF